MLPPLTANHVNERAEKHSARVSSCDKSVSALARMLIDRAEKRLKEATRLRKRKPKGVARRAQG